MSVSTISKKATTARAKKSNRIEFRIGNTLQVFRKGKTTNTKIAKKGEKIVQTYTFAKAQFEYVSKCVQAGKKVEFKIFFSLDAANCLDCPYSGNKKAFKCYTHKYMQFAGFIAMLKSIVKKFGSWANIPTYEANQFTLASDIMNMCKDLFVRFGSYGEPSLHPFELVSWASELAKNWTGYTHQYLRFPEYKDFFMASTHHEAQEKMAAKKGFRSFVAIKPENDFSGPVHCPASNEKGFISNCSKCGLCSGINGKGKKSVKIYQH